jgi:hypothetical protein
MQLVPLHRGRGKKLKRQLSGHALTLKIKKEERQAKEKEERAERKRKKRRGCTT